MNVRLFMTALVVAMPHVALAQAPSAPDQRVAPSNIARPNNCAPTETVPQDGTIAPKGTTTGQGGPQLSDRLAQSDGVLCPPGNVDPQMNAPTPDAGRTPVIPPPGSPGGDPSLRPK